MSNRAWMPLHIADYLADTGHLTSTEHGAYLLMIMHYWQNGSLPENERVIARIAKLSTEQWEESRDILAMLFGPGWSHKRIDAELSKADEIIEKRRAAAEARYSKGKKETSDANAMHMQSRSSDTGALPTTSDLSSLRSDICPEPEKSAPALSTIIELPATKNDVVPISEADLLEWASAFPAVDVPQQLRSMRQWLIANPSNRKTAKGMKRFVVSWLGRAQDRGKPSQHQPQAPPRMSYHQQRHQAAIDALDKQLGIRTNDQPTGNAFDLEPADWRAH